MDTTKNTDQTDKSLYDCNICLGTAKNAVICTCGHLFCWACLHLWTLTPCSQRRLCPVCRVPLDRSKVIPLYGRNCAVQDPSDTMAPRPAAQRIEPSPQSNSVYLGFLFGFHTSLGYGSIPIESLASALNLNDEQALFLFFGLFCLGWFML